MPLTTIDALLASVFTVTRSRIVSPVTFKILLAKSSAFNATRESKRTSFATTIAPATTSLEIFKPFATSR